MEQKKRRHGREFWANHHKEWETSGKGRMEYCRESGISYWSFREWQKRFQSENENRTALVRVPLRIQGPPENISSTIELLINGSIRMCVKPGFDGELLRAVMRELGAIQ
jgi:hypothetical protein